MRPNILVVQPILASYRKNMFDELASFFGQVVVLSKLNAGNGFDKNVRGEFKTIHTPVKGSSTSFYYQVGVISSYLRMKPDVVFMTADLRALNFWVMLLVCGLFRTPVFSHGQGVYDKHLHGFKRSVYKILFSIVCCLSTRYICYTDSVKTSLLKLGMEEDKLSVMHNTLVNNAALSAQQKNVMNVSRNRFVYIGRLRKGCNLELFFNAMKVLKDKEMPIRLEVVGDGEKQAVLKALAKKLGVDVRFHGAIYSDDTLRKISANCAVGIYPGDAGLSVVHYMSLSLIPFIHGFMSKHMGPEPSYVLDQINGVLFERDSVESLVDKIEILLDEKTDISSLSNNAYAAYVSLSKESMASKLIGFIKPSLKNRGEHG